MEDTFRKLNATVPSLNLFGDGSICLPRRNRLMTKHFQQLLLVLKATTGTSCWTVPETTVISQAIARIVTIKVLVKMHL